MGFGLLWQFTVYEFIIIYVTILSSISVWINKRCKHEVVINVYLVSFYIQLFHLGVIYNDFADSNRVKIALPRFFNGPHFHRVDVNLM